MPEMKSLTLNDKTYDCFVDSVARSLASASAVIKSASGESVTLSDVSDVNLHGLRIFGKTTQDGVPSPEAPVDLMSVGSNGSITVDVTSERESQSMTIATPNGLPGIPVDSGGTYTDAGGQQWICDEIDFTRGVYVQRIKKYVLDGTQLIVLQSTSAEKSRFDVGTISGTPGGAVLCDSLVWDGSLALNTVQLHGGTGKIIMIVNIANNVDNFKTYLSEHPITVFIQIVPIETPLSEEELAAYKELHTYREPTTVSNDSGAYMELEYVMDAKKYIDGLIGTGGGSSARLGSVTINASAWKTEVDGLYSQVVTIAGVTPYSKVDLLPSVEQLAIFHNKDVAFVTENEDGVVTVFAIGDKPTQDYTMQVSITEVVV